MVVQRPLWSNSILYAIAPLTFAMSFAAFILFCLSCKRKKAFTSITSPDNPIDPQTSGTGDSNSLVACQLNSAIATNRDVVDYGMLSNDRSPAIAVIANDGSLRIKCSSAYRALPDIPTASVVTAVDTTITTTSTAATSTINGSPNVSIQIANDSNHSHNSATFTSPIVCSTNNAIQSTSISISSQQPQPTSAPICFGSIVTVKPVEMNSVYSSQSNPIHAESKTMPNDSSPSPIEDSYCIDKALNRHHSYARIRDNHVIDSSTENDTDDYCDPRYVLTNHTIKIAVNGTSSSAASMLTTSISGVTAVPPINNTTVHPNLLDSNRTSTSSGLYAVSVIPSLEMQSFHLPSTSHHSNHHLPHTNRNSHHLPASITIATNGLSLQMVGSPDDQELPIESQPPDQQQTRENLNRDLTNDLTNNDDDDDNDDESDAPRQVSYNKISVREPLAKVLAERALMEHHYTEVYEENNSFYEEIPGSTNSSVTYTKIGDITPTESRLVALDLSHRTRASEGDEVINIVDSDAFVQLAPPVTPPPPPPVDNYRSGMITHGRSRSTSPSFFGSSHHPNFLPPATASITMPNTNNGGAAITNSNGLTASQLSELYTAVNKSTKIGKQPKPASVVENMSDLYAKVQKNHRISRNEPNSGSDTGGSNSHTNHPPPLPPLDNIPRSLRTLSMYTAASNDHHPHTYHRTPPNITGTSAPPPVPHNYNASISPITSLTPTACGSSIATKASKTPPNLMHKRSQSTGAQRYPTYDLHVNEPIEDPGYEVVEPPASLSSSSSRHNYEKINRIDGQQRTTPCSSCSSDDDHSDRQRNERTGDLEADDCLVEPGYEVVHYPVVGRRSNGHDLNRNQDDDEDDDSPCYETIHKQSEDGVTELQSEPDYEVIANCSRSSRLTKFDLPKKPKKPPILRTESDVSNEPGYERIRYVPKPSICQSVDQDETYASITQPSNRDRTPNDRL